MLCGRQSGGEPLSTHDFNVTPSCKYRNHNFTMLSCAVAAVHMPSHSLRDARWGYRTVRVGESRIPAPIGDQTTTWTVTAQPDRKTPAACHHCRRPFVSGAARVASAAAALAGKWLHPACVPRGFSPLHDVIGFTSLSEAAQEQVRVRIATVPFATASSPRR